VANTLSRALSSPVFFKPLCNYDVFSPTVDRFGVADHHATYDHNDVHRRAVQKSPPSGDFRSTRAIDFSPKPILQNPAVWTGFFYCPVSGSSQGDGPMTELQSSDPRTLWHGLWLPLVTPFRDGALDETSLRRLVRHYAALPVDGLILAATTGEASPSSPAKPNGWCSRSGMKSPGPAIFRSASVCPAATPARY
jgi:Dihydrodipicolinate synthetase family